MATNHTSNYGLSQWLGTDSFSRLDFNSDNQKIDTALGTIANTVAKVPLKLVTSSVLTSESRTMTLSLTDVDLSKYLYLELVTSPVLPESAGQYHYLRLNGVSTNTYSINNNGTETATNYFMRVDIASGYPSGRTIRFAPYESETKVCGSFFSWSGEDAGTNTARADGVTWNTFTNVTYAAASVTNSMQAGSGLYLYGIEKP